MKRKYLVGVVAIVVCLVIVGCAKPAPSPEPSPTPSPAPAEEPIVLTYASPFPDVVGFSKADVNVLAKIEQDSNGRVKFETYFGGTLISFPEGFSEIAGGVCDVGLAITQMAPSGLEVLKLTEEAYYGCPDVETETRICNEVNAKFPELEADLVNYGKILTRNWGPPYEFLTNKRINTVEDFKGMTFRCPAILAKVFQKLGGNGTLMPSGEAYTAFEKGIIDGCTGSYEQLYAFRWAEVIKYYSGANIRVGGQTTPRLMNWDTWNSLPPDIQKVFDDNWDYWREQTVIQMLDGIQAGIDLGKELGGEFYELPPAELNKFYATLDEVYLEELAPLDAKGLPATEIYKEIRRLVAEYSK